MAETLVIVESPSKAKTIKKYLPKGYEVQATMGHLVDLPKSRLGVDLENNFEPDYIKVRGKAPLINSLIKEAKKAARDYGVPGNYVMGANIAGFKKVANAMLAQGVI